MPLIVLQSAAYVEGGQLNYIVSIATDDISIGLTGNEVIVHNNAVYPATGGTGIPAVQDTNFYSVYTK